MYSLVQTVQRKGRYGLGKRKLRASEMTYLSLPFPCFAAASASSSSLIRPSSSNSCASAAWRSMALGMTAWPFVFDLCSSSFFGEAGD